MVNKKKDVYKKGGPGSYFSIPQLAKMLGLTRMAVYKRVKNGKIKAIKIGKSFAIPADYVKKNIMIVKGKPLSDKEKKLIEQSVEKTIEEYGEVLRRLGNE